MIRILKDKSQKNKISELKGFLKHSIRTRATIIFLMKNVIHMYLYSYRFITEQI